MPTASSAQLTAVIPFPDKLGEGVWRETRSFPVMTAGAPILALLIGASAVQPLALHLLLGAAAILVLSLLVRARERAVIEAYTVTDRFIAVEQHGGARSSASLPACGSARSSCRRARPERCRTGRAVSEPSLHRDQPSPT